MKKTLSILLMLVLLLGAVSAAAAEAKTPLRVVLIGGYLYEDNVNAINGQPQKGMHVMEEQFEALHPDIDLTLIIMGWDDYQKKTQTMIMGDEADVFVAPGLALMGDMLEDLTPYIERDQFDTTAFLDGQLAGWQAQGSFDAEPKQYGFPFQGDTRVIVYDKQLFDEWGVSYLSEHPSWDEILEKATKMTGENPVSKVQNYGTTLSGADAIVQIAESMGMSWGEGFAMGELSFNWNKPEYVAASEQMLKLYALGMVGGSTNFGQADNTQAIELQERLLDVVQLPAARPGRPLRRGADAGEPEHREVRHVRRRPAGHQPEQFGQGRRVGIFKVRGQRGRAEVHQRKRVRRGDAGDQSRPELGRV